MEELLSDSEDFNDDRYESEREDKEQDSEIKSELSKKNKDSAEEEIIHFIPIGLKDKWVFTIGDKDPFPSIPHGH